MQPIFITAALTNNLQCVCVWDTVSFKEFTQSVQDGNDNGGQKKKEKKKKLSPEQHIHVNVFEERDWKRTRTFPLSFLALQWRHRWGKQEKRRKKKTH